ncbi:uncharacterized protein BDZ99DRAFT_460327 [Mytilinidion resinicola]|uniref:BTB domain-containing protein n=1 Tax=Mytilinidion resinicola TaxID=574789 RepID=A0A6A6YX79_9PEZI|nr:uncharacterized protein BDZ99DRAFT_460327 [Mytilinidion resinicola]KAF2813013.1 hypothetical protein BDZ99DRAFT_460327 [Mytilinidion resinicola]
MATPPSEKPAFVMPQLKNCDHPILSAPITTWGNVISVIVGEEKKVYQIHKGLLLYHSSYFVGALSGGFKESDTEIVELFTDEVAVFDAVYCWLYKGHLFDSPTSGQFMDITFLYDLLCKIFVFGDMRGIPTLKNAAIDLLHSSICMEWKFPKTQVRFIYENTMEGSLLRKFIVNVAVLIASCETFLSIDKDGTNFTHEFLMDVIRALNDQGGKWLVIGRDAFAIINRCRYHDHSGPGGKLRMDSG